MNSGAFADTSACPAAPVHFDTKTVLAKDLSIGRL